jgi:selenocysteine lyase/cysteine desulfurase
MLRDAGVTVDVRGHVLRVGLGLYHDRSDLDAFCGKCREVLA